MSRPFDIVVVASRRRKALILAHLDAVDHVVSWTPDYPMPNGYSTPIQHSGLAENIGQYRCFRGHQDALSKSTAPVSLVLEDDAAPNRPEWLSFTERASALLDEYEVVSLHSRDTKGRPFQRKDIRGIEVLVPSGKWRAPHAKIDLVWALGSLAYLIRQDARESLLKMEWDGLPIDLLIANRFKFCTLADTPFNHDRSEGSLLEPGIGNG